MNETGGNFVDGKDICVAEACEYRAGFMTLKPDINCMLNVVTTTPILQRQRGRRAAFRDFAGNTKGVNIVCGDDDTLKTFGGVTFGMGEDNYYSARGVWGKKRILYLYFHRGRKATLHRDSFCAGAAQRDKRFVRLRRPARSGAGSRRNKKGGRNIYGRGQEIYRVQGQVQRGDGLRPPPRRDSRRPENGGRIRVRKNKAGVPAAYIHENQGAVRRVSESAGRRRDIYRADLRRA